MIGLWNEQECLILECRQKDIELPHFWLTTRLRRKAGRDDITFPIQWLPETGLIAMLRDSRGKEVIRGALFIYFEKTCPVAVAGWLVTYPGNTPDESMRVCKSLLAEAGDYARKNGAKHLLTTFGNDNINDLLDSLGFVTGDTGVQHKYLFL